MSGQGFEFTPGGILPLAAPAPGAGGTINAADAVAQMRAAAQAHVATVGKLEPGDTVRHATGPRAIGTQTGGLRRRSLVKEIRERLRAVEREIKNLEWLQAEAVKLRRMLAAAKQPPATVADLHKARKSG